MFNGLYKIVNLPLLGSQKKLSFAIEFNSYYDYYYYYLSPKLLQTIYLIAQTWHFRSKKRKYRTWALFNPDTFKPRLPTSRFTWCMGNLVSKSRRTLKSESVKGPNGVQDIFCNLPQRKLAKYLGFWGHKPASNSLFPTPHPEPMSIDTPCNAAGAPPISTGSAIFVVFEAVNISLLSFSRPSFMCSLAGGVTQCGASR